MADKATNAKKKSKGKESPFNARTMALAVVFLGLIAFVGYRYLGSAEPEVIPEPDVVTDSEGKPITPQQPSIPTEPGTTPPSNLEEVRPS